MALGLVGSDAEWKAAASFTVALYLAVSAAALVTNPPFFAFCLKIRCRLVACLAYPLAKAPPRTYAILSGASFNTGVMHWT